MLADALIRRSLVFIQAMTLIYATWIDSWVEAHALSNASHVLRPWAPEPSSLTTTSTTYTRTSSTATTSTTSRPALPYPQPQASFGVVLGALENVFSDPLELLTRALALDLENNGKPQTLESVVPTSLATRGLTTSSLLHSWCEAGLGIRYICLRKISFLDFQRTHSPHTNNFNIKYV